MAPRSYVRQHRRDVPRSHPHYAQTVSCSLAEVVGDEGADGTESEDMEAHWPVHVSRVACAGLCSRRRLRPRLEYGKVRKAWFDDS